MKYIRITIKLAELLKIDAIKNGRSMTRQLEYILTKYFNL